jgi:hypothetical protein
MSAIVWSVSTHRMRSVSGSIRRCTGPARARPRSSSTHLRNSDTSDARRERVAAARFVDVARLSYEWSWTGSGIAGIDGHSALTAEQLLALIGVGMHSLGVTRLEQLGSLT